MRSYVLRQGRLTDGQARALETQWPHFGIDWQETPLDFSALFGRHAPVVLEIGFGNGDSLLEMARAQPENDFIGIEVHPPGVGHLLARLAEAQIDNLRVVRADAVDVLRCMIAPSSLARVQLFFPDPWPKKRHHKRRIVQPEFIALVTSRLEPGGFLHLATDWEPYAEHMLEVLRASPELRNLDASGGYATDPPPRPRTRFEARGLRLGHRVRELVFGRT